MKHMQIICNIPVYTKSLKSNWKWLFFLVQKCTSPVYHVNVIIYNRVSRRCPWVDVRSFRLLAYWRPFFKILCTVSFFSDFLHRAYIIHSEKWLQISTYKYTPLSVVHNQGTIAEHSEGLTEVSLSLICSSLFLRQEVLKLIRDL